MNLTGRNHTSKNLRESLGRGLLVLAAFLNKVIVDAPKYYNSEEAILVVRGDKTIHVFN